MRVASLLPSATEIVCALGLDDRLVGVSHSCDFPESVQGLPVMTSTHVPYTKSSEVIDTYVRDHLTGHEALYDLDLEKLSAAKPDFIVSQTLCDVCAVSTGDVLAALRELPSKPELIDLEPHTLNDVFDDIERVGSALGVPLKARQLVSDLRERCRAIVDKTKKIPPDARPRVAFLEWLLPPFNGGHWNPELVEMAGGIDLLGSPGEPSATQDWAHIVEQQPDVVFIACCGLSVERAREDLLRVSHTEAWQTLPAVRNGRVLMADGSAYFSCPGPRLVEGLEQMAAMLHPGIFS